MLSVGLSESQIVELQNAFVIEQTHVNTIVSVLQSLNVSPLNQPTFFFQFNSVVDFVEQLSIQEVYVPSLCQLTISIATEAYLGAAPFISSSQILGSAASIMVVEGRQSAFVNDVLGFNAFSDAFETSLSIEQVVSLVAPSIVSLPSGTVLDALGFNTQAFALPSVDIKAFSQVQINSMFNFNYVGGQQITPPSGVNQLYCAWSFGSNTFYTSFNPGQGCQVSSQITSGTLVTLEITVSESLSISDLLTAPQFVTCL
jgi:hypothetical protein